MSAASSVATPPTGEVRSFPPMSGRELGGTTAAPPSSSTVTSSVPPMLASQAAASPEMPPPTITNRRRAPVIEVGRSAIGVGPSGLERGGRHAPLGRLLVDQLGQIGHHRHVVVHHRGAGEGQPERVGQL